MSATPRPDLAEPETEQVAPRVVLVTGASSGIGRATAVRAAAAGDHVVLAARGRTPLEDAARECEAAGAASTLVVPVDVGDDDAVADLVRTVLDRHARLDAVVNSAGVVSYGRFEDVPAAVFDGVLRTNLLGSANIARHALAAFRDQGHGSLVLVGSVIGHVTVPGMGAYVVSKWGVRALARQLAVEHRGTAGIRVDYVAPGGVDTPIYQQAGNFAGFEGRPPPPVSSPEHVAGQILARLERRHLRSQLSLANEVIRFGFSALPAVYDAIVAPLFTVSATDLNRPIDPTEGNVLHPVPSGNHLHGDQGNALVGLGRNLATQARRALGR